MCIRDAPVMLEIIKSDIAKDEDETMMVMIPMTTWEDSMRNSNFEGWRVGGREEWAFSVGNLPNF